MYCLAVGVPLTEEHLIPRALGGRRTLSEAVCEPCRRFTGRLEQATLDREFVVPRTLLALKRLKARGRGVSLLPPLLLDGDDVASVLTAAHFPRVFSLPVFEPAGLLAGVDRGGAVPRIGFVSGRIGRRSAGPARAAATLPLADPPAYGYAIAKWAYALAVAERGVEADGLQALRDLLLGRRDDVFNFVGSCARSDGATTQALHAASLHDTADGVTLRLALFAASGMTLCEVVIARRRDADAQ